MAWIGRQMRFMAAVNGDGALSLVVLLGRMWHVTCWRVDTRPSRSKKGDPQQLRSTNWSKGPSE
jgi:hypothetical protein